MTDRPILFSGPMVRAILDGRKSQTRRVLRPQPNKPWFWPGDEVDPVSGWFDCIYEGREPCGAPTRELTPPLRMPYAPGDRLYLRERFYFDKKYDDLPPRKVPRLASVWYSECHIPWPRTAKVRWGGREHPSIHMPRRASRLTLVVTDVRVQRLQEINNFDAVAEGIELSKPIVGHHRAEFATPRDAFKDLWGSLNDKRGYGWDVNPWVAAVTFEAHQCNIDQMGDAA